MKLKDNESGPLRPSRRAVSLGMTIFVGCSQAQLECAEPI
jgi:hypothetical protein